MRSVLPLPLAVILLCGAACRGPTPPAGPNVVLISIDTLRADHVGSYGYDRDTTPHLDSFARQGIRFDSAYSPTNWTLPAHASVMTSQRPGHHGVTGDEFAISPDAATLSRAFRSAGYRTAAVVSWIYVGRKFGFARHFDHFRELVDAGAVSPGSGAGAARAGEVTSAALEWLDRHRDEGRPFFLFVHYFDPHLDYDPPHAYDRLFDADYRGDADGSYRWIQPYIAALRERDPEIDPRDVEHLTALYDGEIRYTDDQVGRLLGALAAAGLLEDTVVMVMSDHGEEFAEHGSLEGHGWTLYEEVLRVPLLLRLPGGQRAGEVVEDLVSLLDVGPTLLGAAGIPAPDAFEGRDLLRTGAPDREDQLLFAESDRFRVCKRSVRGPRFKLIYTADDGGSRAGVRVRNGYELYSLLDDPGEQENIFDPANIVGLLLADRIRAWDRDRQAAPAVARRLSAEEEEMLRSLGYIR